MNIKGKAILTLSTSVRTKKEYLEVSISSKDKDGKYNTIYVCANVKNSEQLIKSMKAKGVGALLIDIQNGWLNVNTYEVKGEKRKSLSAYIEDYKVLNSFKTKEEKVDDEDTPF